MKCQTVLDPGPTLHNIRGSQGGCAIWHPALKEAADQLAGNPVGGYSEHRALYFAWHRNSIVQ
ncbi:hypothetical protein ACFV4T_12260 [Streptomyces sp. NPDC059755]|uniref:hypothetical protein n=1 Tax=Streptomyces sp. NPDC059755 TaxID=3346934 RepID=UPI00365E9FDA